MGERNGILYQLSKSGVSTKGVSITGRPVKPRIPRKIDYESMNQPIEPIKSSVDEFRRIKEQKGAKTTTPDIKSQFQSFSSDRQVGIVKSMIRQGLSKEEIYQQLY